MCMYVVLFSVCFKETRAAAPAIALLRQEKRVVVRPVVAVRQVNGGVPRERRG